MSSSIKQAVKIIFDKQDRVFATAAQIVKDLAMFGIEINFSGNINNAYEELHGQLVHQIDHLIHHFPSKFIAVLYRIDIDEKLLDANNENLKHYNEVERVSHIIIERELKKVLTRMFYKTT